MAIAVALVLLVVVGVPLAFAITRDLVVAVVLAPLVTGLQCTAAAAAMVVIGGPDLDGAPFALWLAIVTVASWGLAAVLVRRPRPPLPSLGVIDLVVMYGPLLLPALLVRRPPVAWDARSIWWFHAAWIDAGAATFREALGNPVFVFSHPDYPVFAPATVAGAWTVTSGSGLWVAQAVSTILTLSAVAVFAYTVRHLVPSVSPMVARFVSLGVGLSAWAVAGDGVTAGYVDHLWAAALAAAVMLLFIGGRVVGPRGVVGGDRPLPAAGVLALAAVLLTVAALTKNEGLVAAAIVAVVFTVRARRHLRRALLVWLPVAVGFAWLVVARALGATSDLSSSPRITQLLDGDLEPLGRAGPTLSALAGQTGWFVGAAAVVSVIGVLALGQRRRALGLVGVRWPWAVVAGYTVAVVATYVVSPYAIEWHLATSIDRVSVLIVLVAAGIVASWVLVAVAPDPDRTVDRPARPRVATRPRRPPVDASR